MHSIVCSLRPCGATDPTPHCRFFERASSLVIQKPACRSFETIGIMNVGIMNLGIMSRSCHATHKVHAKANNSREVSKM